MDQRILIRKAKKGDTECFARLYEQVYKKMYQYAFYTLRSEQDAEDAVSETVVEAFEKIGQLRAEDAFEAWIFRILIAKCKGLMKDYYRPQDSYDDDNKDVESNISSQSPDISDSVDMALDVREGMARLDASERQIISMHVILGYKTREIAELIDMNENTVRSKESRALGRLKNILKDWR